MPRQLVRLAEVRAPEFTADSYSSAQIQSAEDASVTSEDYLQFVLSQIRLLQGTQSWKDLPSANVSTVVEMVQATQAQLDEIGTLATQVAALQNAIDTLAPEQDIVSLKAIVSNLTTQLAAQAVNTQSTFAALNATLSAQQAQIAQLVTPQGLENALRASTLFDQPLYGVQDRSNRMFHTQQQFVQETIRVFLNGQRLYPGALNDYTVAQSVIGGGYNQIILTSAQIAPRFTDLLTADFIPA
jgi:hypothetical protein